ncbi:MAG: hypothetical protein ACYCYA_12205 [Actinomycetes bacterium]
MSVRPPTVVPARARTRRWGTATTVVVLLLVGGVVASAVHEPSRSSGSVGDRQATGQPSYGTPTGIEPVRLARTGLDYTPSVLPGLVRHLVSAPSSAQSRRPLPASFAHCVTSLAGTAGVRPVAVDDARFEGHPVYVVVLPGSSPVGLDVWVVGRECVPGSEQVRYFAVVARR